MRAAFLLIPGVLAAATSAFAVPPLDEILTRVADSQERTVEARKTVVYHQTVRSRLLRGGSKIARDEHREYVVTPTEKETAKECVYFLGWYEKGGELYPYDDPEFRHKKLDLDGELIESLTDDLVNDKGSRDGLSKDLFPLTRKEQRNYDFELAGTRKVQGVDAIVIKFQPKQRPKDKDKDKEEDDDRDWRPWSGEVLVHPDEYQPMLVTTSLNKIIPGWVKVVFGINIKQLGFNVTYRKVADGLWFPTTYGTEFGLRLFFGYGRTITLSMENADFRMTSADSSITYETAESKSPQP